MAGALAAAMVNPELAFMALARTDESDTIGPGSDRVCRISRSHAEGRLDQRRQDNTCRPQHFEIDLPAVIIRLKIELHQRGAIVFGQQWQVCRWFNYARSANDQARIAGTYRRRASPEPQLPILAWTGLHRTAPGRGECVRCSAGSAAAQSVTHPQQSLVHEAGPNNFCRSHRSGVASFLRAGGSLTAILHVRADHRRFG